MSKAFRGFLDRVFPVGVRSVLFGAHCWFIHPWFVLAAWTRLYGIPWDPRLHVAFWVHDLGYAAYRCRLMDDEEGERHPRFGAEIMGRLFDVGRPFAGPLTRAIGGACNRIWGFNPQGMSWYCFVFYHSRFLAKRYGMPFSRLCVADKLALVLTPAWLYLPMVNLSGEIREYMKLCDNRAAAGEPTFGKYSSMNVWNADQKVWWDRVQNYLIRWVEQHQDGREDTWTPNPEDPIKPVKDSFEKGTSL